jgi:hypothetical protein
MMIELLSEFEEVQGEVQREEGAFGRATTWCRTIECSSLQLFKCNTYLCSDVIEMMSRRRSKTSRQYYSQICRN